MWYKIGLSSHTGLLCEQLCLFLMDLAVESLFCHLLAEHCKVEFMGIVEWFLGIHFSWCITLSVVVVHLNQSGFASNLVERFFQDTRDPTPMATPYQLDIFIDAIAPSTEDDNSPALKHCKEAYQSLIGSIGCLSCSTCPDLAAAHSFLLSYNNKTLVGHMKAALYTLH
jgi:hypothetical protein